MLRPILAKVLVIDIHSLDIVAEHGRDNLDIKNSAASNGVLLHESYPAADDVEGKGKQGHTGHR